ncbi:hypothetical protein [Rufibacter soli]
MPKLFPNKLSIAAFLFGLALIIIGVGSLFQYPDLPEGGWFFIVLGAGVSGGLAYMNLTKKGPR